MREITISKLKDQGFTEVSMLVDGESESVMLYRDGDAVHGFLNVCPHAGRRLDWAPGEFLRSKEGWLVCAVHGASFDVNSGECVAGPCRGEALRSVPLEREGDVLRLPE